MLLYPPLQATMAVRVALVALSLLIICSYSQAASRHILGADRDRYNNHQTRMTSAGVSQDTCKQNGWNAGSQVATTACGSTQVCAKDSGNELPAHLHVAQAEAAHTGGQVGTLHVAVEKQWQLLNQLTCAAKCLLVQLLDQRPQPHPDHECLHSSAPRCIASRRLGAIKLHAPSLHPPLLP